ncbi:unnamed protein product, partial [Effrenium voratum]
SLSWRRTRSAGWKSQSANNAKNPSLWKSADGGRDTRWTSSTPMKRWTSSKLRASRSWI